MRQSVRQVHILPSAPGNIQSGIIETTLISPQNLSANIKQITSERIPMSIPSQNLSTLNQASIEVEVVDHSEPQNLVKIRSLGRRPKLDHAERYLNPEEHGIGSKVGMKGVSLDSDSTSTIINLKHKLVQTDTGSISDKKIKYTETHDNSANTDIDHRKNVREKNLQNVCVKNKNRKRTVNNYKTGLKRTKNTSNSKDTLSDTTSDDEYIRALGKLPKGSKQDPNNTYIEAVVCSKCRICGYLTTSSDRINSHLESEHLDLLEESVLSTSSSKDSIITNWTVIAQKHQIPLRCPLCINTFRGTHLSFKVHLMDDHALNEDETNSYFNTQNQKRRTETLEDLKKRRREIEIQRKDKKEILEAYVDDKGELRVRTVKRYVGHEDGLETQADKNRGNFLKGNLNDNDCHLDVSAKEYIDAVKISQDNNLINSNKEQNLETVHPNEKQRRLIDLTKRSTIDTPKNITRKTKKQVKTDCDSGTKSTENINSFNEEEPTQIKESESLQVNVTPKSKRTVGRPKGSRSIGLTKLKRLNPKIQMHDKEIGGTTCEIDGCAVRLRDENKLDYHRKCHTTIEDKGTLFQCLECSQEKLSKKQDIDTTSDMYSSESWKRMALHLWRVHKIDMELYSCDICQDFKEFTMWRLEEHKIVHQVARPFLCNECGKCFKTNRNLKMHSQLHKEKSLTPEKIQSIENSKEINCSKGGTCDICNKGFTTKRFLRHHTETVHKGLKPYMCNFCG